MVEFYLFTGVAHRDTALVPQPVPGVCGPKASTLPHFTNLPLSTFIGDFTLEKHAEIEPSSVAFRKDLIASELNNRNILLRNGRAGAAEVMKELGLSVPSSSTSEGGKGPSGLSGKKTPGGNKKIKN
ncbi:hypothetical protein DFH11DRAFT_1027348 [Phellopilus nigrolimitatus]|nr:hypothetical protein DFH11DRAFT_1027348 [Phellopilus nigrolimitatus]